MSISMDTAGIEYKLSHLVFDIGDEGVKLLAKKLASHAKKLIPILTPYGIANKAAVPNDYKADPGEIQKSVHAIKSKKVLHSYLVNVQDWRAHFLESGTKPHTMSARKGRGPKARMAFLGSGGKVIFRGKVNHPGTKAAGFLEKTAQDSVVNYYVGEVTQELASYYK